MITYTHAVNQWHLHLEHCQLCLQSTLYGGDGCLHGQELQDVIRRGPPRQPRYHAHVKGDGEVTYEEDKETAGLRVAGCPVFVPVPTEKQLKEAAEQWQQRQHPHLRWKM